MNTDGEGSVFTAEIAAGEVSADYADDTDFRRGIRRFEPESEVCGCGSGLLYIIALRYYRG